MPQWTEARSALVTLEESLVLLSQCQLDAAKEVLSPFEEWLPAQERDLQESLVELGFTQDQYAQLLGAWLQWRYYQNRLEEVGKLAESWVEIAPRVVGPGLFRWAGNAAREVGEWEPGIGWYQRGRELFSKDVFLVAENLLLQALRPQGQPEVVWQQLQGLLPHFGKDGEFQLIAARAALLAHQHRVTLDLMQEFLSHQPEHPVAMSLLAMGLQADNRYSESGKWLVKSNNMFPGFPLTQAASSNYFAKMGDKKEQLLALQKATRSWPGLFRELEQRALVALQQGRNLGEVRRIWIKAAEIHPQKVLLKARLGFACLALGDSEEAGNYLESGLQANGGVLTDELAAVQAALAAEQGDWLKQQECNHKRCQELNFHGLASYSQALFLMERNQPEAALPAIEKSLGAHALVPAYQRLKAEALYQLGQVYDAIKHLSSYLQEHPKDAKARDLLDSFQPSNLLGWAEKGTCFYIIDELEKAKEIFELGLQALPDESKLLAVYGKTLIALNQYEEAEEVARRAFKLKVDPLSLTSLAGVLFHLGGYEEEVIQLYEKTIKRKAHTSSTVANMALARLNSARDLGSFLQGMKEFEYAFPSGTRLPWRKFLMPQWEGESLKNKTLLVWREQGVGDELAAAMHLPAVIEQAEREGGKVIFECTDRMLKLFQKSFPSIEVRPENRNPAKDQLLTGIHYQCPVYSLLRVKPLDYQWPPKLEPFIEFDAEDKEKWQERVAALGEGLKIGICWRSGKRDNTRDRHYATVKELAPLMQMPGVQWVNLTYQDYEEELDDIEQAYGVRPATWKDLDLKNNFYETACLTQQLDLVIAPASTPRVMAAWCGVPAWVFSYGTPQPKTPPDTRCLRQYPAVLWPRHYTEGFNEVFERMAMFFEHEIEKPKEQRFHLLPKA